METIRQLINDNKTDEALHLLDEYIKKNDSDDEAYYLRGNVYRKMGDIRQALNNYLMAIELNPDSPAQTAYNAQIKILDFYNKDMYNHYETIYKCKVMHITTVFLLFHRNRSVLLFLHLNLFP